MASEETTCFVQADVYATAAARISPSASSLPCDVSARRQGLGRPGSGVPILRGSSSPPAGAQTVGVGVGVGGVVVVVVVVVQASSDFFTREKVVTQRWLDPSHGGLNLGFPQHI